MQLRPAMLIPRSGVLAPDVASAATGMRKTSASPVVPPSAQRLPSRSNATLRPTPDLVATVASTVAAAANRADAKACRLSSLGALLFATQSLLLAGTIA